MRAGRESGVVVGQDTGADGADLCVGAGVSGLALDLEAGLVAAVVCPRQIDLRGAERRRGQIAGRCGYGERDGRGRGGISRIATVNVKSKVTG